MAIIKWNNRGYPTMWPGVFDDDFFNFSWPEVSSERGLNIYETDNSVIVEADVPGIPEDKVNVTVEGNVLTISGSIEETEEEKKEKKVVYKSNRQSSFSYSTSLPRMIDSTSAEAEVENGVVKVIFSKADDEKPQKINVKRKS